MGKESLLIAIVGIALLLLSVAASASMLIPANANAKNNAPAPVYSPVIGNNWDLERVDFIHYAKPVGRPSGGENCYKLLGVKWKAFPVSYAINPANPQNISADFVTSAIFTSAETWDAVTSQELFNDAYSVDYSAQYGVQDYKNSIAFGDYPDSNAIAVTSVWFTRVGKQIVEFDIILNTRFRWGNSDLSGAQVMDLQNIATHELGHAAGLDDIYSTTCSLVTMYGYSSYGETSKRTLEQPDILGLQKMYS